MATSPQQSRPDADRRRRQQQFRRRRLTVLVGVVAIVLVVALVAYPGGGGPSKHGRAAVPALRSATDAPIPAVEAGVLPWTLQTPLSREAVLPGGSGTLLVIGGLSTGAASSPAVLSLDVRTGNRTSLGALAAGVHDSAAAVTGTTVSVMGGGTPNATGSVQQFPATPGAGVAEPPPAGWTLGSPLPTSPPIVITGQTTATAGAAQVHASTTGQLPRARTDHSAVVVAGTTYVVGGYDGTNADADVLATTDGIHYRSAGRLVVAVRYPAVATIAGKVYLFGGEAVGGPNDGAATDTVQVFDPKSGRSRVVGNLDTPVAGASAFDLGGNLYLAGGVGNSAAGATGAAAKLSSTATDAIWAWSPATGKALPAGKLAVPVAYAGTAVTFGRAWLVGGETQGQPTDTVQMALPNPRFGTAGAAGAGSPYFGYKLLIADRGNDRLQVLNPGDQPVWSFPSVFAAAPPGGFYFPDDAFFAKGGTEIVSNQERNHTLVIISFPSGQVLWQYGHPLHEGSAPGYLSWPDDAYVLKTGEVTVADDRNCRILFINPAKQVTAQLGTTGACNHRPPTQMSDPNGDTPLPDGNYLVSEINGQWISEYTKAGQLVWTTHLPIHYPSDPQQLGPDLYLVSDYAITPGGAIDEFNREGQIVYRLQPTTGVARMNQPSLTELLPSGVFMTNDDYRDRMVAFDPPTGALVWQYGVADKPGTAPGYLNTPDGFDLLAPDGSTPTHPATG